MSKVSMFGSKGRGPRGARVGSYFEVSKGPTKLDIVCVSALNNTHTIIFLHPPVHLSHPHFCLSRS
jgi:hypothetical protein